MRLRTCNATCMQCRRLERRREKTTGQLYRSVQYASHRHDNRERGRGKCIDTRISLTILQSNFCSIGSIANKAGKHDNAGTNTALSVQVYSALKAGPYSQQFLHHQYKEMNDNLCTFLNQNWSERPQMRYACSRLLAGAEGKDTMQGGSGSGT
jgi:hypothetical protein